MKLTLVTHTGGHVKVSINTATEAFTLRSNLPGPPVKCQMLASQTLMNAAMQLFSVCHYALELRVDVLTGLGHTSVPALLALS